MIHTTNTMKDERALIARLLAKDKRAVKEFYETYTPRLFRFIKKRIENDADGEEIAQDTLFAFLDKARDFTFRCQLSTYLCSIAHNKIVDHYRKKKLKKVLLSQIPENMEYLLSVFSDPGDKYDNALLHERISGILKELAPHYRQILTLKYVEGKSVVEIARELSVTFKSAESILFRARAAFVKIYTGALHE